MQKNINKFMIIFNDLKKYNDDYSFNELLKASKDLIKYSKQDYIDKNFTKTYDNDNRKPLDKIFSKNKEINIINYDFYNDDEKDLIENCSIKKFQQINNKY